MFVAPLSLRSVYALKCSVYSGRYGRAHVHDLQLQTARMTGHAGATHVCREDYRQRQVGECADTWYKRIQPTETVDL